MKWIALFLIVLSIVTMSLWAWDGAWVNGAMPTDGLFKTIGFASVSLLCFKIAGNFNRAK